MVTLAGSTPIPQEMLAFSERIVVILILAFLSLTCIVGKNSCSCDSQFIFSLEAKFWVFKQ